MGVISFWSRLLPACSDSPGISAASADIARVLFYIFGVIFLILLILGSRSFERDSMETRLRGLDHHITLVSVTTETKVPTSTNVDAGSIQVLY